MKQCPTCGRELRAQSLLSINVDECPHCKGIWFEKDELRHSKDHADKDLNWMDFEIWKHPDLFEIEPRHLKCPKCQTEMVAIRYGETKVTVDYCKNCQGIWLDRNEFKQIIDALENELTTKTTSEYVRASIEEAKKLFTGSESFLSEWRDLKTVLWLLELRFFVENPRLMDAVTKIPPSPIS